MIIPFLYILILAGLGFEPNDNFRSVPLVSKITDIQPMTGIVLWATKKRRRFYA
jgi:hypothetical protein